MSKLIILLFMTGCAHNSGYRKHDATRIKYTVREYYLPSTVNPSPSIQKPKKPLKRAKKTLKIDCGRVFKEVNQCMK